MPTLTCIGQANYTASKSGLFGLTKTLAREAGNNPEDGIGGRKFMSHDGLVCRPLDNQLGHFAAAETSALSFLSGRTAGALIGRVEFGEDGSRYAPELA
jgi:hypothetical protein